MPWINCLNVVSELTAPPIICLMGATATGKTSLALDIAERFPVEIISVDSALIYRHMDIGTAKPDINLRRKVPHFLIDIIDPVESYSVWNFLQNSRRLIIEITERGNIPLLVGGTMMYFYALENGLNHLPEANITTRLRLNAEARKVGWLSLYQRLVEIDPETASQVKPGDSQRIQRALEVFEMSGVPLSALKTREKEGYPGSLIKVILQVNDRQSLHARIKQRFYNMLEQGLIDEVARLKNRSDLNLSMPSMRCVGYRQVWQYLDGIDPETRMIEKAIAATRQLAKRQLTWLRKQSKNNTFNYLNSERSAIFSMLHQSLKSKFAE